MDCRSSSDSASARGSRPPGVRVAASSVNIRRMFRASLPFWKKEKKYYGQVSKAL